MSTLLHGHHANEDRCPLSFGMDTPGRVQQIERDKPEAERPLRLLLLREVDPNELPNSLWEAYARREEAYVKLREADAKHREDYARWQKAYAKYREADAKWEEAVAKVDWDAWHREHCGGVKVGVCKWTAEHPSIFAPHIR